MNMSFKKFAAVALGAAAFLTGRAETYTLTTDMGTFKAPVAIETLSFAVGSGGADKTFAEMIAAFQAGDTLVKKGSGVVLSAKELKAVTGTNSAIRIEEGLFVIANTNHLGATKQTAAPQVTILDGATLVIRAKAKFQVDNKITFAGKGVRVDQEYLGAICNDTSGISLQDTFFNNALILAGEATIRNRGGYRFDFYTDLYLQGHSLTYCGTGTFCWSGVTVHTRASEGIIIDSATLQLQGGANVVWEGSAANTLTFTNNAGLAYYNNNISMPWTIVWATTGGFSNSSKPEYANGWGKTTHNRFNGPFKLNCATMRSWGSSGTNIFCEGVVFNGPVSGPGGLYSSIVLHFNNANNSFEGPVGVCASWIDKAKAYLPAGVFLYYPGALPFNDQPCALTNAMLRMADDQVFNLRPISVNINGDTTNNYIMGGAAGSTAAALRKTGKKTLDYLSCMNVTGTVELAEGTLRLKPTQQQYSAVPGLWHGFTSTNRLGITCASNKAANAWMDTNYMSPKKCAPLFSNSVDSCTGLLYGPTTYPPWEEYEYATWSGYLWNRSPTNENWTFAFRMSGYLRFFLNSNTSSVFNQDDNGHIGRYTAEVKPGPNFFALKVSPRSYNPAGAAALDARSGEKHAGKESTKWPAGWGISIDRQGRDVANIAYFERMMNNTDTAAIVGGDGFWYTRDTRDTNDFTEAELSAVARQGQREIRRLVATPGTVFDLGEGNCYPYVLPDLVGLTTVKNGGLIITNSWTIPVSQALAQGKLAVEGALTFSAAATITLDEDTIPHTTGLVSSILAEAKGGITMPSNWQAGGIGSTAFRRRYALRLANNNTQLVFDILPRGTMLILR